MHAHRINITSKCLASSICGRPCRQLYALTNRAVNVICITALISSDIIVSIVQHAASEHFMRTKREMLGKIKMGEKIKVKYWSARKMWTTLECIREEENDFTIFATVRLYCDCRFTIYAKRFAVGRIAYFKLAGATANRKIRQKNLCMQWDAKHH